MDVLSDVLDTVRVENGLLFQTELAAPWGIRAGSREQLAFHVVTRGRCWLAVAGMDAPIAIETGDVVVLAPWRDHSLSDAPDTPAHDIEDLVASGAFCQIGERQGSADPGVATTELVCGWIRLSDPRSEVLLSALPAVLHARELGSEVGPWLAQTVRMLSYESRGSHPGTTTVVNRLCDALFVYVLRSHLASLPPEKPSWLRALVEPQIGEALQLIHDDPGAPWSVDKLAANVGMSRSAFSARFTRTVGEAPMQYLARWRVRKAAALLREGTLDLTAIARRTGYSSAAAFSKAFTREHELAPGAYRRVNRPA
ncbi:MAG: AraC family transcriptional regulator [Actinomycetota bacterium]|nr:AraC family transcriptional regulator [Actinomycetota bacterium]